MVVAVRCRMFQFAGADPGRIQFDGDRVAVSVLASQRRHHRRLRQERINDQSGAAPTVLLEQDGPPALLPVRRSTRHSHARTPLSSLACSLVRNLGCVLRDTGTDKYFREDASVPLGQGRGGARGKNGVVNSEGRLCRPPPAVRKGLAEKSALNVASRQDAPWDVRVLPSTCCHFSPAPGTGSTCQPGGPVTIIG